MEDAAVRPNHLTEPKASHCAIFHCGSERWQGLPDGGDVLKIEGIGEMREILLTSLPSTRCTQI